MIAGPVAVIPLAHYVLSWACGRVDDLIQWVWACGRLAGKWLWMAKMATAHLWKCEFQDVAYGACQRDILTMRIERSICPLTVLVKRSMRIL